MHAEKMDTAEAAFAPQQAKMVFAALITAFERSHRAPAIFRDRGTPNLRGRSISCVIPGA